MGALGNESDGLEGANQTPDCRLDVLEETGDVAVRGDVDGEG